MKKVLLLLMSFFLCFCIIDKSDCEIKAYSNYRVLSVPNFQQSNSNTCWVAVGTAILHSKGYLITYVQYRNACGVTYDRTATIYEIRRGFIAYNQSHSTAITGYLTFNQIMQQIDGYSAAVVVEWKDTSSTNNTGHVVALKGYNSSNNMVYYMDPAVGTTYILNYNTFVNYSAYSFEWYQTVYNIY